MKPCAPAHPSDHPRTCSWCASSAGEAHRRSTSRLRTSSQLRRLRYASCTLLKSTTGNRGRASSAAPRLSMVTGPAARCSKVAGAVDRGARRGAPEHTTGQTYLRAMARCLFASGLLKYMPPPSPSSPAPHPAAPASLKGPPRPLPRQPRPTPSPRESPPHPSPRACSE